MQEQEDQHHEQEEKDNNSSIKMSKIDKYFNKTDKSIKLLNVSSKFNGPFNIKFNNELIRSKFNGHWQPKIKMQHKFSKSIKIVCTIIPIHSKGQHADIALKYHIDKSISTNFFYNTFNDANAKFQYSHKYKGINYKIHAQCDKKTNLTANWSVQFYKKFYNLITSNYFLQQDAKLLLKIKNFKPQIRANICTQFSNNWKMLIQNKIIYPKDDFEGSINLQIQSPDGSHIMNTCIKKKLKLNSILTYQFHYLAKFYKKYFFGVSFKENKNYQFIFINDSISYGRKMKLSLGISHKNIFIKISNKLKYLSSQFYCQFKYRQMNQMVPMVPPFIGFKANFNK